LGEIYAEKMNSNINRISVAIRQLDEGGVWRCGEGDPRPAALLMCDIRRGRPAQQRAELARMLIGACVEIVGLSEDNLNVEFTQHAGDEMFHPLYGGQRRLESRRARPIGIRHTVTVFGGAHRKRRFLRKPNGSKARIQ
jgi:hypothetical protein